MDLPPAPSAPAPSPQALRLARWAPWLLVLAAAAPPLVLPYLPMADLPQHVAIASILRHLQDPAYGFAEYYQLDPARTLYLLPYALAVLFGTVLPIKWAMHVVVSLSIAAYLGGMLRLLQALRRPWPLLLLAVPFAYNRAFFWGFVSFNLAFGLAILAIALFIEPEQTRARKVGIALALLASIVTHTYGIALFLGYAGLWALTRERRALLQRLPLIALAVVAAGVWTLLGSQAKDYLQSLWLPLWYRVLFLPSSILGGYKDYSESAVLVGVVLVFAVLTAHSFPVTRARWRALALHERLLYALIAVNVVLYFVMPVHTKTAKLIHFRHAVIAASLLPAVAGWTVPGLRPGLRALLLGGVGLGALLNAWLHFWIFSEEARSFDPIVAALPQRSRTLYMAFERNGAVMDSAVYVHFGSYAQAERGGLMSVSFPHFFWNLPLRAPDGSAMPALPEGYEWNPERYDEKRFGYYYDHVIVRSEASVTPPEPTAWFPYRRVVLEPPWQLFERVPVPAEPSK